MIKDTLKRLDKKYFNKFLFRKLNTRRTHLYCTGTVKSGTHSIWRIFKNEYRSEHEPNNDQLIDLYFKIKNEKISKKEVRKLVAKRERGFYYEMNSSSFNFLILDELLNIYPDAKFIHTVREPCAWLDSWINHNLNHDFNQKVQRYFDSIFKRGKITYEPEEKILKKLKLPTIDGMLSYWKKHNDTVIKKVPEDRLLTVKTKDITDNVDRIVRFAGLNKIPKNVNSHAYKASEKHGILDQIDKNFVNKKINEYRLETIHL